MMPWTAKMRSRDRDRNPERDEVAGPISWLHPLEWFIRLRWVFIGVSLSVLVIERLVLPTFNRPQAVWWTLILLVAVNVAWWCVALLLRRKALPDDSEKPWSNEALLFANAQIAIDLVALTVFVRCTGGIESPLAIFYVFHMALGPLLLPVRYAMAQGLWAMTLYAAVALGELSGVLAPHYFLLPTLGGEALYLRPMYVMVALTAVSSCVIGTIYLTATISVRLRIREKSLRETNAALCRSQTAIRDLQARRSRFMQTAAHRLKSPLATVQTLASLIRDEVVQGANAGATYERIARCCNEGIDHVAELLTLARVQDADPERHRLAKAQVGAVTSEVCARFQAAAASKGVELSCTVPPDVDLCACVDPRDLADCIGNVVDNAIKFTPTPGAVSVSVNREETAGEMPPHDEIVVRVDDTGIGFDTDSLAGVDDGGASVFDAYRRGNNALAAGIPGSGLGLAIVRAVVEQAGGRITVHSIPRCGTQFTLRFFAGGPEETGPAVRNTRATSIQKEHDVADSRITSDNAKDAPSRFDMGQPSDGPPNSAPQTKKETDHALC
jgi:signal transduction histidine kinase